MAEPIITIASAARKIGLGYHVLLRLIHERRVPSVRVAGTRRVRSIPGDELYRGTRNGGVNAPLARC